MSQYTTGELAKQCVEFSEERNAHSGISGT